jgi:hypothetical protein
MGNEWIIALILVVSYLMYIRSKRLEEVAEIDRLASYEKINELLSVARSQSRQIGELNNQMTLLQAQIDIKEQEE